VPLEIRLPALRHSFCFSFASGPMRTVQQNEGRAVASLSHLEGGRGIEGEGGGPVDLCVGLGPGRIGLAAWEIEGGGASVGPRDSVSVSHSLSE